MHFMCLLFSLQHYSLRDDEAPTETVTQIMWRNSPDNVSNWDGRELDDLRVRSSKKKHKNVTLQLEIKMHDCLRYINVSVKSCLLATTL